jgi:hypothetical protein
VAHYLIYRNGVLYGETTTPECSDEAVSEWTTYTCGIVAQDCDLPHRAGVRPTGSYWGSGGEQLDMLTGNVNFTLPLLAAMGRNGSSVGFRLSYTSQLWFKHYQTHWKLGREVGYGFGWRLQAGSLTPCWQDPWIIHHYTFIDSTGAEYRLDVSADGERWTSREGIYLTYDRVVSRLYFPDGSFWVMGSGSSGAEQDAGTRYPTLIQDTNGNQLW